MLLKKAEFIIRYMNRCDVVSAKDPFFVFLNCCNKIEVEIASVILETLKAYRRR